MFNQTSVNQDSTCGIEFEWDLSNNIVNASNELIYWNIKTNHQLISKHDRFKCLPISSVYGP